MNRINLVILTCLIAFHLDGSADLKDITNQADYIIICPKEFNEALLSLKEWRESKGLKVELVSLDDIYQEFNTSETQTDAIRDFLIYAYNNWQKPAPKYILLAGAVNYIPIKRIKSNLEELEDSVSIDEWFITGYDSSQEKTLPLMALGRFPARNVKELNNMIFKTKKFEDDFDYSKNKYVMTAFTDKKDSEVFIHSAETLWYRIGKPKPFKRIYQSDTSRYSGNRDTLIASMKEGSTFLFNFIHGTPNLWGYYKDFQTSDFDTLVLSVNPFILTSISCSQYFDDPINTGIIEKILTADTNNAVAAYAASGLVFAYSSAVCISKIFNMIFGQNDIIFGDAILEAKQLNFNIHNIHDQKYTLLGDPALLIRTDKIADVEPDFPTNDMLAIFPNPASDMANIRFLSENSGYAILEVLDVMGRSLLKKQIHINSLENVISIDLSSFESGIYFIKAEIGGTIKTAMFAALK